MFKYMDMSFISFREVVRSFVRSPRPTTDVIKQMLIFFIIKSLRFRAELS